MFYSNRVIIIVYFIQNYLINLKFFLLHLFSLNVYVLYMCIFIYMLYASETIL